MNHVNKLYIDIEAVKPQTKEARALVAEGVKPPARIKKPESIEKWEKEGKKADVAEAIEKAVFDGAYCHIVCISVALNNQPPFSFYIDDIANEKDMLQAFFDYVSETRINTFIGHNVLGYDLRIIKQRAMVLGVKPPAILKAAFDAKPWDNVVYDTMLKWDSSYGKLTKLDKIAKVFGLAGKDGITGADVGPMWEKGLHHDIAKYCENDVEETRAVEQVMTWANVKEDLTIQAGPNEVPVVNCFIGSASAIEEEEHNEGLLETEDGDAFEFTLDEETEGKAVNNA